MWILLLLSLSFGFNCKFTLTDGTEYDLSEFQRTLPDYEVDVTGFIYRFNICADTVKLCHGDDSIASQWNYNAGCVAVIARQGPVPPKLARIADGLSLTYSNGDNCDFEARRATFNFHCVDAETRIGLAEEPSTCHYSFDLYSRDACFGQSFTQKNHSWVFYGLILVAISYLAVGWVYNKHNNNELGFFEAIPHFELVYGCIGNAIAKVKRVAG